MSRHQRRPFPSNRCSGGDEASPGSADAVPQRVQPNANHCWAPATAMGRQAVSRGPRSFVISSDRDPTSRKSCQCGCSLLRTAPFNGPDSLSRHRTSDPTNDPTKDTDERHTSVRTFFTDSSAPSARETRSGEAPRWGPALSAQGPTRTPRHLTGSRPDTRRGRPIQSSRRPHHRAADPSLEPPAEAPGRSSPNSQPGPGEHSVFLPNTNDATRGLTVLPLLPQQLRYGFGGSLCPAQYC